MGYKCSQCGIDFPNKKGIVDHMADVHGSVFLEGDPQMVAWGKERAKTNVNLKKVYEDAGEQVV